MRELGKLEEVEDLFYALAERREAIEAETGLSVEWEELPQSKRSRIRIRKNADFENKEQWNEQFEWLIEGQRLKEEKWKKYE